MSDLSSQLVLWSRNYISRLHLRPWPIVWEVLLYATGRWLTAWRQVLHSTKVLSQHHQLTIWSKPNVDTYFPVKLKKLFLLIWLTYSFNKQSLFARNLVKTTKRRIQCWQYCFSSEFCSVLSCVIASFLSVQNWTSVKYRFVSFSLFFCNHFHKDRLHLSHAQMHSIVVLLLYW